jgi:hypothetical protein
MKTKRAHILLPRDLADEIDSVVGPRGRSAFIVESVRESVRRRKLLRLLDSDEPLWQDRDHPELKNGSGPWVRKMRGESDARANRTSKRSRK